MPKEKSRKVKYYLNQKGEFVIENYNLAKPFANFFPGIAGKFGIPMWVFYVNRGQAIASFGTKDKDHAILEFFPANKAWQLVSTHGFRTFLKITAAKKTLLYEPFHNGSLNLGFGLTNRMYINPADLILEEENLTLGLSIRVEYFNIPNEPYAGLARIVTVKNLSRKAKKIDFLDGLPQVVPFGTSNFFLKKLGRTIEAWMNVTNLEKGVPFFKLAVDPADRPEVIHIQEGNFYLGFHYEKEKPKIIKPITDPEYIFGPISDFSSPYQFLAAKGIQARAKEVAKSKTPSAFLVLSLELGPQEEKVFSTVIGYARNLKTLNSSVGKITEYGYLEEKCAENRKIIAELQENINTQSSLPTFDLYSKQTYLDNIIRGGYPILFKTKGEDSVFYLYSRKHGDLERDYNKFQLQPTYFSQGNGNYRDINQNRRSEVWFCPQIKDENIITFFSLLQTDGFNPLVVKGMSFQLKDDTALDTILPKEIISFINKPFTPGELMLFIQESKIKLKASDDNFLSMLLGHCVKIQEAEHGEGFWTDHWTYNLDLLESYLAIYPENLKEIIFEKKSFTYYDNTERVRPRSEKYLLYNGFPRQLHSVVLDTMKKELIRKRTTYPHTVRKEYGKGEIYETTLINKLFCLAVNKLSSLDPFGVGIEMEANKPNWYDALNGLPALFGSSICETLELKRLFLLVKDTLEKTGIEKIYLAEEVHEFLISLNQLIEGYLKNNFPDKDYQYWDKSSSLKEKYRQKTRLGLSGKELEITTRELTPILKTSLLKLDSGIKKALDQKTGVYYSYFINEVVDYAVLKSQFIKPLKFKQKPLPFFLAGQMHALKLAENPARAKILYSATRKTALFDRKLKMYKVTAPLASMPEEIGRCRIFTPGWLENESIWLHMEYKYLLETLRQGLFAEFYEDFKNVLIPFQKPEQYGRSILENSSFLVSSAFPDKKLQGNGFLARLSGSTAEFLQIWLTMNIGKRPFFLNEKNKLCLNLKPILAGWLFDKKGLYSFNFLSKIRVIYHNPKRRHTFGKNAAKIKKVTLEQKDKKRVEILSEIIPPPFAEQVRSGQIQQIDAYLE